jgi:hypothetical protein
VTPVIENPKPFVVSINHEEVKECAECAKNFQTTQNFLRKEYANT